MPLFSFSFFFAITMTLYISCQAFNATTINTRDPTPLFSHQNPIQSPPQQLPILPPKTASISLPLSRIALSPTMIFSVHPHSLFSFSFPWNWLMMKNRQAKIDCTAPLFTGSVPKQAKLYWRSGSAMASYFIPTVVPHFNQSIASNFFHRLQCGDHDWFGITQLPDTNSTKL